MNGQRETFEMMEKPKSTFPAIVISNDAKLTLWHEETTLAVDNANRAATALEITDDASMDMAVDMKRTYKEGEKQATEVIKPYKQRLDEVKKQILDVEKDLAGGYKRAADTVMSKINNRLDYLEAEKKKEEARLREIAEKDKEKRLKTIHEGLNKILGQFSDLNEQRQALEMRITEQEITVEEAEIIRIEIEAIDKKLGNMTQRIETKQIAMEEAAAPMTVNVNNFDKPKGMSSTTVYEVAEIHNQRAVLREIIDGRLPIACITFNLAKIKQAGNDQVKGSNAAPNIPGVTFTAKRDTRIR